MNQILCVDELPAYPSPQDGAILHCSTGSAVGFKYSSKAFFKDFKSVAAGRYKPFRMIQHQICYRCPLMDL